MHRKIYLLVILILVLGLFPASFRLGKAETFVSIWIEADGSISPSDAPVLNQGNSIYLLTQNISGTIFVLRSNIVLDGAGHEVLGVSGADFGLRGRGIDLEGSSNVTIRNFELRNSTYPIYLAGSCNDTIIDNVVTATDAGILVDGGSNNTRIVRNKISGNWQGIALGWATCDNVISGNVIEENSFGVSLFEEFALHDNTFYHNNFIRNTENVWSQNSAPTNFFNSSSEGNYWSGYYVGADLNLDGIRDSPFSIGSDHVDYFPLMGQFHEYDVPYGEENLPVELISNSTISNFDSWVSIGHPENGVIWFNVTGSGGFGFSRISIPHSLIAEPYHVFVDGAQPNYLNDSLYDNGTHRWMYFSYTQSTHQIVINGPDTAPPIVSIQYPDSEIYKTKDVPLTFSLSEPWSWLGYSLDNLPNTTISGNTTMLDLPEGTHSITVCGNDTAGNMGYSNTVNFIVDAEMPAVEILSPENRTYGSNSLDLSFVTSEPISWVGYSLDGKANETITSNTTLTGIPDGTHTIVIYANDTAGHMARSEILAFSLSTGIPLIFWIIPIMLILAVGAGSAFYLKRAHRPSTKGNKTNDQAVKTPAEKADSS